MTRAPLSIACILTLCSTASGLRGMQPPAAQEPSPQQQSQVDLIIGGRIGARPTFAVPDCLAPGADAAASAAATTIAEVLWNDLEFEREFRMMARDTYDTIPRARSLEAIPFDRWLELGVDGVVSCRVEADGPGRLRLTARLFNTRSRSSAFGVEYSGSADNIRLYATSCPTRSTASSGGCGASRARRSRSCRTATASRCSGSSRTARPRKCTSSTTTA